MSTVLITGGSGFIGTNLAHRLLGLGHTVCIFDNLSRQHVVRNLSWLTSTTSERLHAEIADIRDRAALRRVVKRADHVFHLAAQVAVTSSVEDPKTDFDINVGGTLQLLEEIRLSANRPSLVYTSTNKVYGSLEQIPLRIQGKRYVRADEQSGIDETMTLNFHSPYGCSKGAAEQYVLDYCRTFGMRTAVFRMSCIYGPHQFGTEDQGWVAHILSRAMAGKPVTIYGDGRQVRDILFVEDLVRALLLAQERIDEIAGEAFNIGGGPENTISLLEFIDVLGEFTTRPQVRFSSWRIGDQKYYVSSTRKFQSITGWTPRIGIRDGVTALYQWLEETHAAQAAPELLVRQAS
jgi:CDP-paratose 2-epimerase